MVTATRTRDDVAADLTRYRRRAARLSYANEDWPILHAIINDLLDELQRMGWLTDIDQT